jgi:hypothetical protein
MMDKSKNKTVENIVTEVVKKESPYRDERGVRIQKYRRFHEGKDFIHFKPRGNDEIDFTDKDGDE